MAICYGSVVLLVVIVFADGITAVENQNPMNDVDIMETQKTERVCQIDEPCYYGYVKLDQDYAVATYRTLPTW